MCSINKKLKISVLLMFGLSLAQFADAQTCPIDSNIATPVKNEVKIALDKLIPLQELLVSSAAKPSLLAPVASIYSQQVNDLNACIAAPVSAAFTKADKITLKDAMQVLMVDGKLAPIACPLDTGVSAEPADKVDANVAVIHQYTTALYELRGLLSVVDANSNLKAALIANYAAKHSALLLCQAKPTSDVLEKQVKLAGTNVKTTLEKAISDEFVKQVQSECSAEFDINAKIELLKTGDKDAVSSLDKELNSHVDSCITAYNEARVLGNLETRNSYRKKLEQIKKTTQSLATGFLTYGAVNDTYSASSLAKIQRITNQIVKKVDDTTDLASDIHIIPPWKNEGFTFQFYSGLEATSVNDFLEKTNARIGMQLYTKWTNRMDFLRKHKTGVCKGLKRCSNVTFGFHTYLNATITSTAEHTFVTPRPAEIMALPDMPAMPDTTDMPAMPDTTDTLDESADNEDATVEQVLIVETGIFTPIYTRSIGDIASPDYQEFMLGPILTAGINFTDGTQDKFNTRYYGGVRSALNEETYFDVLFGHSEKVKGWRSEIRGQFPVSTLGGGRLFLGGKFNVGIDSKKEDAQDAWQIYLQWQASFDELWQRSE